MNPFPFIYSDKFQSYDYGGGHPLKMIRLKLTCELLRSYGVFGMEQARLVEAVPCTRAEAELVHNTVYLDILKGIDEDLLPPNLIKYGLGPGDNPVFRGVYAGSMLSTGASVQAARMVQGGEAHGAFNIAGGLHHAMPGRASGFCYINDPAVAIAWLVKKGLKVAYIDIDAHHGDGVQRIFYDTSRVMTISLHESGDYLFPGGGFEDEIGEGDGRGFSVNVPLHPSTGDEAFTFAFSEVVPPLIHAYRPDIIVAQLGCDTFESDPLTDLRLTTHGFTKMVREIAGFGVPWVGLGGGGYSVTNVARAWSLAYSIMAGIELPDTLPDAYLDLFDEGKRPKSRTLNDPEPTRETKDELKVEREFAEASIRALKKDVFPLHGIKL